MQMKSIFILFVIFMLSCSSSRKYQTAIYDHYAPHHKKIAILPIAFDGKSFDQNISDSEKLAIMQKELKLTQNALYQKLLAKTGLGKKDIKIQILSLNTTNDILTKAGIDLLKIEEVSDERLSQLLNVDAILRTKISTTIMLHSTKNDIPKEVLSTINHRITNPILSVIINLDIVPVFLTTELIDGTQLSPIWAYSKKRDLEIHDKNTDLASWLFNDVSRNFPYRE
jgi:hypothetical protein